MHDDKRASDLERICLRIDGYIYFLHANENGPGERGSFLTLACIETLRIEGSNELRHSANSELHSKL